MDAYRQTLLRKTSELELSFGIKPGTKAAVTAGSGLMDRIEAMRVFDRRARRR